MSIYCPSNLKFTKIFRKSRKSYSISGSVAACNAYSVKSMDICTLNYKCFMAFVAAVNKEIKSKGGRVRSYLCFDFLKTKKPICSRMGGGKGGRDGEHCKVFKGSVILFIDGVSFEEASVAVEKGSHKLPIRVSIVRKNYIYA